jgi:hypothetical protein
MPRKRRVVPSLVTPVMPARAGFADTDARGLPAAGPCLSLVESQHPVDHVALHLLALWLDKQ